MKFLGTFFLLALALCARGADEKLRVSSFSTVLTEIAREIGGDKVEVTGHVKPGVDPHEFSPRPADIETVASSEIILVSSRRIEGYVEKLRQAAGGKSVLLEVGAQLPGAANDPHWWHSIGNIMRATRIVRDELIRQRPAAREYFFANAAAYIERLRKLEKWVTKKLAEELPRDRRKLVTNHDSFGAFARDFGFEVYPIAGITKNDQPGGKKVAEIIGVIRAQGVKAIFSEDTENPKVIGHITRETGVKIGGSLLSDGLGAKPNDTVDAMFRHNVTTIVEALK